VKILVGTPIFGEIPARSYVSHCNFWYRVGRTMKDTDIMFYTPERMPIDHARNHMVEHALSNSCDYLFFYDTDMVINPNLLSTLVARDKPVITGLSYVRGYPFVPMCFKYGDPAETRLDEYEPTKEDFKNGLFQVDAIGTSTCLINTKVFKEMEEPWFDSGLYHTEDIFFCAMAKQQVPWVEFWVDTTVESGHLTDAIIVNSKNVEALREFYAGKHATSFFPTEDE
jgi:hypothetical protein